MSDERLVSKGYNGFSGVDIRAVYKGKTIGLLQGVSYTVSREVTPVYSLGGGPPAAYRKSSWSIGGSLVFVQLNDEVFNKEVPPLLSNADSHGFLRDKTTPWYKDQIPPFDIILAMANEYGSLATMRILGVELLNEGFGTSVDDIVTEQSFNYIAREIEPWKLVEEKKPVITNKQRYEEMLKESSLKEGPFPTLREFLT